MPFLHQSYCLNNGRHNPPTRIIDNYDWLACMEISVKLLSTAIGLSDEMDTSFCENIRSYMVGFCLRESLIWSVHTVNFN